MPDPIARVRKKLERYTDFEATSPSDIFSHRFLIPGPPAWNATRTHRNLKKLPLLVPPRVASAVFKCVWNDWCTARRFQKSNNSFGEQPEENKCWLGCKGDAQDCIEHYSRCPIALDVLFKKMRVKLDPRRGLSAFALTTTEQARDNDLLSLTALHIYATYMSRNFYRNNPSICNGDHSIRAKQCLGQYMIQGCHGHARLARLLDNRWGEEAVALKI